MSKHTPGPWHEYVPTIAGKIEPLYHFIDAGRGTGPQWDGGGFHLSGWMSSEDARLIATAPDLLKACQAVVRSKRGKGLSVAVVCQIMDAIDKAEADDAEPEGAGRDVDSDAVTPGERIEAARRVKERG